MGGKLQRATAKSMRIVASPAQITQKRMGPIRNVLSRWVVIQVQSCRKNFRQRAIGTPCLSLSHPTLLQASVAEPAPKMKCLLEKSRGLPMAAYRKMVSSCACHTVASAQKTAGRKHRIAKQHLNTGVLSIRIVRQKIMMA